MDSFLVICYNNYLTILIFLLSISLPVFTPHWRKVNFPK
jgi:hypothetical protein